MKRKVLGGLLIFCLLLGLAGCQKKTPVNNPDAEVEQQEETQKEQEPDKKEEEELPKIRVGVCKTLDALPLFYLQESELDRQGGFLLTVEPFDTFQELSSALENGELDGVLTDTVTVMAFAGKETKLKITGPADCAVSLLAGANAGATDLSQCNGKMVCMPENTGMEYILDYLLAQNNYVDSYVDKSKADSYETVLMILEEEPELLVLLPEPYAAMARQQGAVQLASSADYGLSLFVTAFREDFLVQNSGLEEAFTAAYQQAVTELSGVDIQEKTALFAQKAGISQESVKEAGLPEYRLTQIPSEEELEDVYYWCLSKELYEGEFHHSELIYSPKE